MEATLRQSLSSEFFSLIERLSDTLSREDARLAGRFELTRGELRCLRALLNGEQHLVGRLTKELEMNASQLSRVLDRLEDRDLIARSLDKKDRRNVDVVLRDQGLALAKESEEIFDSIIGSLDTERIEESVNLLKSVIQMIEEKTNMLQKSRS